MIIQNVTSFFFFFKLNTERTEQSLQLDYLAKVAKYPWIVSNCNKIVYQIINPNRKQSKRQFTLIGQPFNMSNCLLNVSNAHSKILEQSFHFMVLYVIKMSLLRSVHGKLHKYASAVFLVQALTLASFIRMHVRFNVFYLLFYIKKFCLRWVMSSLTLHKDSLRVARYYALVNAHTQDWSLWSEI